MRRIGLLIGAAVTATAIGALATPASAAPAAWEWQWEGSYRTQQQCIDAATPIVNPNGPEAYECVPVDGTGDWNLYFGWSNG